MPLNKCAHCSKVPSHEMATLTLSPSQAAYESKLLRAETRLEELGTDVVVGIGKGAMYTGHGVCNAAVYAGRNIGHAAAAVGHDIHDFGVSAKDRFSKSDAIDATKWDVGQSLDVRNAATHTKISHITQAPNSLSAEFHDFLRDSTAPDSHLQYARSHHISPQSYSSNALVADKAKAHARVLARKHDLPMYAREDIDIKEHALAQTRARHEVAKAEQMAAFARTQATQSHVNSHAYALHARAAQDAHVHARAQRKARLHSLHTQAHYQALAHVQSAAYGPHSGEFGVHSYHPPFY